MPHKHLQFLVALSKGNDTRDSSAFPPTASTSRPRGGGGLGTPSRPGPSTASILAEGNGPSNLSSKLKSIDIGSPPDSPTSGPGAKSKAALLREWRTARGRAPFPESLLLRDTLYLLQGIDGRFVRFALAPAPERNPYLTEKGRAGDGAGFPLGAAGTELPPAGVEDEVMGIDIVADEAKVGTRSGSNRN